MKTKGGCFGVDFVKRSASPKIRIARASWNQGQRGSAQEMEPRENNLLNGVSDGGKRGVSCG